jgi:cytochrome c oxidase cbb3-type subunit I/II
MENPNNTSPGSIMPPYPWLLTQKLDTASLPARIKALRSIGVPYPAGFEQDAEKQLKTQAKQVADGLLTGSIKASPDTEIIALIAYLQRLGTDIKGTVQASAAKP